MFWALLEKKEDESLKGGGKKLIEQQPGALPLGLSSLEGYLQATVSHHPHRDDSHLARSLRRHES